ncbi:unnamed protein product, partial [Phaeothamnion confervicola]
MPDCANAVRYGDPQCRHGGELYRFEGNASAPHHAESCAHCLCPAGWAGVDCRLCRDVAVCPPLHLSDGRTLAATNCSSGELAPTEEEAI